MARCIYCRQPLTGSEPPEHVIPQGFGTFEPNLTLHCVCSECNGFFGRTFEWAMRNSSLEGVLRLQYGLGRGEIGNIGTDGIEFRIAESPDWKGARVVLRANKHGKPYIDVLPQVGARRNPSEDFTWCLEKDLTPGWAASYPKGSEFRIVGLETDHPRLEQRLLQVCPTFQKHGTMGPPMGTDGKVGVNFIHEFSSSVRRFLAKIAFNYMAWAAGPDFALRSEFDTARAFVRDGTEPSNEIVRLRRKPILGEELLTGVKITNGHVVTLNSNPDQDRVEGQLTLFNALRYTIVLAPAYSWLWFVKGHHFDIHSRQIRKLRALIPISQRRTGFRK